MKKALVLGSLTAGVASSFAAAPEWVPDTTIFNDTVASAAGVALAVVVGVAGVRLVIKLINRAVGK